MSSVFTPAEIAYLESQRLGRLATVDGHGDPQNNPVGFRLTDSGVIEIGGRNLGQSRKVANLRGHERVSLVVDDLASVRPWRVRGIEIRGRAEFIENHRPPGTADHVSSEVIRLHPDRILSWGVDPELTGMQRRSVSVAEV